MVLKTVHLNILDAVKSKLGELSDLNSVTIGELAAVPPDKYPCVFIVPRMDEESPATTNEDWHTFGTWVIVLHRSPDSEAGQRKIVELACDVEDKILEDRTLGGKCEVAKVLSRNFDYEPGKDYFIFWCVLEAQFLKEV